MLIRRFQHKSAILFIALQMLARHSVCTLLTGKRLVAYRRSRAMSKLVRIVIQLPVDLKTQLDGLKQQGYTTSGFIRAMLERELAKMDQVAEQRPITLVPVGKRVNSR